eukprot:2877190-Prymnesium_polylepis.1
MAAEVIPALPMMPARCNTTTRLPPLPVKAYLAKWDIENELTNAVNLAVKEDSDDPYRIISDYLRALAKEQDDEDDDEDDIIMEGDEMPVMAPRTQRAGVCKKTAHSPRRAHHGVVPSLTWKPPARARR